MPAWTKDAQAVLAEPLFYLINQFVTDENFGVYLKKVIELLFSTEKPLDSVTCFVKKI